MTLKREGLKLIEINSFKWEVTSWIREVVSGVTVLQFSKLLNMSRFNSTTTEGLQMAARGPHVAQRHPQSGPVSGYLTNGGRHWENNNCNIYSSTDFRCNTLRSLATCYSLWTGCLSIISWMNLFFSRPQKPKLHSNTMCFFIELLIVGVERGFTCLLANTSRTASLSSSSASILISSSLASFTRSLSLLSTTKIRPVATRRTRWL